MLHIAPPLAIKASSLLVAFMLCTQLGFASQASTTQPVESAQEQATPATQAAFSGNTSSKVYHKEGCRYFNCKQCSVRFNTATEAQQQGFRPCKLCL